MAQEQEFRNVDPRIWQECAGSPFTVPKLHSRVYYSPTGHLEHSSITPNTQTLSLLTHASPLILCTVSSIDFLADLETDQIFAKLLLTPVNDATAVPLEVINQEDNGDHVVSYAKTISMSDASNGCAFAVPMGCASIFPPLDSTTQLPSQELSVTDVCGVVWTIRYAYRRKSKRYVFTTGWSTFCDKKLLVHGDTLVFIKNSAEQIFVGIRRKNILAATRKVTDQTVMKAVELAQKNTPFEVWYYPTVDGFDFVVEEKVVKDAMKIPWYRGMRVTHMVKNDDTSKGCSFFVGKISAISHSSTDPWRMLEVVWDDPKVSENLRRVSPWQVKPIFKDAQGSAILSDTGVSSIPMEPLNQLLLNFHRMRGVGQNHYFGSTSSNSLKDSSFEDNSMVVSDKVSTEHISDNHSDLNSSGTK